MFKKLIDECRRVNNLYLLIIFTTNYRKPRYTNNLARHRDPFFFFFNVFSFTHQRIFLQTYTTFLKFFFKFKRHLPAEIIKVHNKKMKNARVIEFDYTNLITSSDLIFIVWFTIGFDKASSYRGVKSKSLSH